MKAAAQKTENLSANDIHLKKYLEIEAQIKKLTARKTK